MPMLRCKWRRSDIIKVAKFECRARHMTWDSRLERMSVRQLFDVLMVRTVRRDGGRCKVEYELSVTKLRVFLGEDDMLLRMERLSAKSKGHIYRRKRPLSTVVSTDGS